MEEEQTMKFGVCLPNNWGVEDVQAIFLLAVRAEELGFDSVWVSEHIFNVSYVYDRIGSRPYYEPLTILGYVAAMTKRVALGTSVLVLPYHNPIRLAKIAATLDVVSGGRLQLGVGVGVIQQELQAMGSPFAERGAITDEAIAVMKALWTQDDPHFEGRYHRFSGMKFSPKPLQKPHIPLLIGGVSRAAIRRAADVGNGWHPNALAPDELAQKIRELQEQAQVAGRDVSEIPISIRLDMGAPRGARGSTTESRYSVGTDPSEIQEKIAAFASLGVAELIISPTTGNPAEVQRVMEILAQQAIPVARKETPGTITG
jgi:probable F420-dependent oxidoreductase